MTTTYTHPGSGRVFEIEAQGGSFRVLEGGVEVLSPIEVKLIGGGEVDTSTALGIARHWIDENGG